MILFRDQELTPERHIAFAPRWGQTDANVRHDEEMALAFDMVTAAAARVLGLADYGLNVGGRADFDGRARLEHYCLWGICSTAGWPDCYLMPDMSVSPEVEWWLRLLFLVIVLCGSVWPFRASIIRWIRSLFG